MKFAENRKLAWIVLVVCVLFSLSFSSERALANLRLQVETVFVSGAHNDGLCINNDLKERAENAYNIASTASNYSAVDSALVQAARDASNALASAETISEKYAANVACQKAVEDLYTAVENTTISETDRSFILNQYKEFQSRADTIKRDHYNQRAMEYNSVLDQFPANLLARLARIDKLELFDS
ncbi:MAG: LemA family protein [Clostridia bacterium]|nr:LemA family protein [Clostridia bacterium]